jgi:hypothetical protein
MRRITSHAVLLVTLLGALGSSGCATTAGLLHWGQEKVPAESPQNPVARVVAMWDPGEGRGTEGKTTRGFVGQIMFFTAKDKLPAKVHGGLQVFVYDDEGTQEEKIKPVATYSYTPESLAGMFQMTELGGTYASFVPYPKPGMHKANCSLRLRYIPVDPATGKAIPAAAVVSEMAYITLPGVDRTEQAKSEAERKEKDAAAKALAEQRVQTLGSIKKPESKRIAAAPLTDAERERIIAEARAREADEPNADDAPPVRSRPLEGAETEEIEEEPADDVADAASVGNAPTPSPTLAASATKSPPARKLHHPLASWSDTEPFPGTEPAPAKRRRGLESVSLEGPAVVEAVAHSTGTHAAAVHPISAELPQPTPVEHPTFAVRPVEAPRPVDAAECKTSAPATPRTWAGWLFTHGLQCLAGLICLGYAGKCIRPIVSTGRRIAAVIADPR